MPYGVKREQSFVQAPGLVGANVIDSLPRGEELGRKGAGLYIARIRLSEVLQKRFT